eukprot:6200100-Pleurochrysis_carterae.AAC.4
MGGMLCVAFEVCDIHWDSCPTMKLGAAMVASTSVSCNAASASRMHQTLRSDRFADRRIIRDDTEMAAS